VKSVAKFLPLLFSTVSAIGFSLPSSAATLTFENVTTPGNFVFANTNGDQHSYTEAGYLLYNTRAQAAVIASSTYSQASWYGPASSSDFYSAIAPIEIYPLTLREVSNAAFSLTSLDIGGAKPPIISGTYTGGTLHLQGITAQSTTFDYVFEITDQSWHTLDFSNDPDFQNLKSLNIFFTASTNTVFSFALDNINVSTIPIPSAAFLFGSGILGVIGLSRRDDKVIADESPEL
jgi:hypothetical protein